MTTLRNWLLALFIVAAMSLSIGCGAEPAAPAPVVHEVCTVTLRDDGSISCSCEVSP